MTMRYKEVNNPFESARVEFLVEGFMNKTPQLPIHFDHEMELELVNGF